MINHTPEEWMLNSHPDAVKEILDDRWRWVTEHVPGLKSRTVSIPSLMEWLGFCWYCGTVCDPYHGSDADFWGYDDGISVAVCKNSSCIQEAEDNGCLPPGSELE